MCDPQKTNAFLPECVDTNIEALQGRERQHIRKQSINAQSIYSFAAAIQPNDGTIGTTDQNDFLRLHGFSSSRRIPHIAFVGYRTSVTATALRVSFFFLFYSSSLTIGGGGPSPLENRLKTCTSEDPTTTKRKKKMRALGTFDSSVRSAALPTGTAPRLVIFLSNLLLRLRIFRGRGCDESWID